MAQVDVAALSMPLHLVDSGTEKPGSRLKGESNLLNNEVSRTVTVPIRMRYSCLPCRHHSFGTFIGK